MKKPGKVRLVNYSNELYVYHQADCSKSALKTGGFDEVFSYSPKDIDIDFFEKNSKILQQKRGNGYWLWKPYFIKRALDKIGYGEYLFYSDSGVKFIKPIDNLFLSMDESQDIIPFELPHIEKYFTKRDTFILMNLDDEYYHNSKQLLASYSLWKRSDLSINFLNEWIYYSQDERIITDLENQCGLPNFPEFVDHRHDQSIFSLLLKKYKIIPYRDPSQFGNSSMNFYKNSTYPQFIDHLRLKHRIRKKIKKFFLNILNLNFNHKTNNFL